MPFESLVLDEIRRLHEDRQTGILSLTSDKEGHVDVFFREGLIEAVSSNSESHRLGEYLVKDGYVPAREIDAVHSEAQRSKIFFGEAVVRKKLVDRMGVAAAVRSQSIGLLEHAVKNNFSVGSFTNCLRSYYMPARFTFPHILLELSRNDTAAFEPESEVLMTLNADVDLSVFPWYPQELCVLNELKSPKTFSTLLGSTGLRDASLRKVLGVLERLSIIRAGAGSVATGNLAIREPGFAFEALIPEVTNAVLHEKLEVARSESSSTSEQFKNLKVNLREMNPEAPLKVFTVSSPDAQDGKSLVSASLAFSFSKDAGRKVIIIDCDLRKPSLAEYLGVSSDPGLLQYLEGGLISPYCFVRRIDNLYFMTAGGVASNPIEVLSMRKMKSLVDSLKNDFDTIILDAPPYSPIADARIVTGMSDGLIMVVRRGRTSYSSADHAFKAVDRNKLLGVVFNDVKPMFFRGYQNSSYFYSGKGVHLGQIKASNTPKNYLES